jgi:hypothetical protein
MSMMSRPKKDGKRVRWFPFGVPAVVERPCRLLLLRPTPSLSNRSKKPGVVIGEFLYKDIENHYHIY